MTILVAEPCVSSQRHVGMALRNGLGRKGRRGSNRVRKFARQFGRGM